MTSWQKRLQEENDNLVKINDKLNLLLVEQGKRLALYERITNGPPTIMMACERIVESAAQLTTNANNIIDKARRL